jgi:hypothetical protein
MEKKTYYFDYLGTPYTDSEGHRVAEGKTAQIQAYDVEHAKLLFEKEYPDEPYDEPD